MVTGSSPVGSGCDPLTQPRNSDDRRHDEPRTLVEKTPDADLLREMICFAAQGLMELEVESRTGGAFGEKSPERLAQRNGYRDRIWETAGRRG